MKHTDYSSWSVEDLKKEVAQKREALRVFRFGEAGARARDVREGRNLRKDVARLLTELRHQALALMKKKA
ncbi:50S ribosomal protein L29 [Candidatus Kaiserbacteria bacterium]|nr:50S ribosomal protein L29 [Candidatus Kaiserbacteria bacterium]